MSRVTKNISKEYYDANESIRKSLGISFNGVESFGRYSKEYLAEAFECDENLNNIPLTDLHVYGSCLRAYIPEARKLCDSDIVSVTKHCIIFEMLGATPIFDPELIPSVSTAWLLNELAGMSFPNPGQAYDYFKDRLKKKDHQ